MVNAFRTVVCAMVLGVFATGLRLGLRPSLARNSPASVRDSSSAAIPGAEVHGHQNRHRHDADGGDIDWRAPTRFRTCRSDRTS